MINWLLSEIYQIRFAICFLTLLPFGSKKTVQEQTWARSIKYFTLVGYIFAFVNIFWFLLFVKIGLEQHKSIFALIIILSNLFLSGGLHLDGLMDSFDGVAASKPSREDTLRVMKDSRAGAFAVMAAIVAILSSWVLLSSFDYQNNYLQIFIILFLIPISSRFLMILVLLFQVSKEQALSEGSSLKAFKEHSKLTIDLAINLVFFLIALILIPGFFVRYFILMLSSYAFALWLKRKLKGHNGDSLGATLVVTELVLLFSCL